MSEDVKENGVKPSQELADHLRIQAFKHRDFCAMKIAEAKKELDHWKNEHDVITAFLVDNQVDTQPKSDEPWFDEKDEETMAKHVQNLRDEVRQANQGWNYGPTDLR
jgi:hypothetical protein